MLQEMAFKETNFRNFKIILSVTEQNYKLSELGKEFEHRGNNNCRHYFHLFVFVDIPCFLPSKVLFLSQSHFHLKDTAKNRNTN